MSFLLVQTRRWLSDWWSCRTAWKTKLTVPTVNSPWVVCLYARMEPYSQVGDCFHTDCDILLVQSLLNLGASMGFHPFHTCDRGNNMKTHPSPKYLIDKWNERNGSLKSILLAAKVPFINKNKTPPVPLGISYFSRPCSHLSVSIIHFCIFTEPLLYLHWAISKSSLKHFCITQALLHKIS